MRSVGIKALRSRWDAALEEEARRGSVKLAKRKKSLLTGPPEPNPSPVDMQKILDELREDRCGGGRVSLTAPPR